MKTLKFNYSGKEYIYTIKSYTVDFTKKLLEEYGYTYFVDDEDYEYFSKDVQLKVETDWRGYVHFEPTQRKGSKAMVSKVSEDFLIKVFSEKDYLEWIKQLKNLGYKENNYDEKLPEEDGWTILGAHGNLFKLYQDGKGNSVEFMKDGDGYIGYSVFDVNFSN